MEQLKQLNQFRIEAEQNFSELERIRERHINSLSRVDSKMDDYYNIINAIRAEIISIILDHDTNLQIEVINTFNCKDEKVLMAKIDIYGFPSIYKSFSQLDHIFYNVSREETVNDFVIQSRLKELAIEWLVNREQWSEMFAQPFANAVRVVERFVNDEAVAHFFKRRPILL